jgi:hypothetical protein
LVDYIGYGGSYIYAEFWSFVTLFHRLILITEHLL